MSELCYVDLLSQYITRKHPIILKQEKNHKWVQVKLDDIKQIFFPCCSSLYELYIYPYSPQLHFSLFIKRLFLVVSQETTQENFSYIRF